MQRHRFYAPKNQISGNSISLSGEEAHHLSRVLRLDPSREVSVLDGEGDDYLCRIVSIASHDVQLEIIQVQPTTSESPIHVTLAQGLVKGDKFDFIVQKATELGVSTITPLETDHSDVKVKDDRMQKKLERWRRISLESLKQCGRSRLVEINEVATVREVAGSTSDCVLLAFTERGGITISEVLSNQSSTSRIVALVGPEGGWSEQELALFTDTGCVPVTLGPRILRTETAAVVALTLIQHRLGDLSRSPDD